MLTEKVYDGRTTSCLYKRCLLIAQRPMLHALIARACIIFKDKQPRRSGFTYPSHPYIMEAEISQLEAGRQSSTSNMVVFSDISSREVQPCELINSTRKECPSAEIFNRGLRKKRSKEGS